MMPLSMDLLFFRYATRALNPSIENYAQRSPSCQCASILLVRQASKFADPDPELVRIPPLCPHWTATVHEVNEVNEENSINSAKTTNRYVD